MADIKKKKPSNDKFESLYNSKKKHQYAFLL
jgi:hypothetical protein